MLGIGFASHRADVDHRAVQGERMETIARRLLACGFPIGIDCQPLGWPKNSKPLSVRSNSIS